MHPILCYQWLQEAMHQLTMTSCRGTSRNGRHYDDDIIFERETGGRRQFEGVHRGRGARERDDESSISDHRESRELTIVDNRDHGRRFKKQADPREKMWTEITRNLVSVEAIKEKGYEYEETPEFFYVMEYLRYVSRTSPASIYPV